MKDWGNYTEEEKFRKFCCESSRGCVNFFFRRPVDNGNNYHSPTAGIINCTIIEKIIIENTHHKHINYELHPWYTAMQACSYELGPKTR